MVEVVYASMPGKVTRIVCEVTPGATLEAVIRASGLLHLHPEIDLTVLRIGVFGQLKPRHARATADDRIEVYRPLSVDPKTIRRLRAKKKI